MIDLSQLREVSFDVENQTAWLQPECAPQEFQELANAPRPSPSNRSYKCGGLGGFLLGGVWAGIYRSGIFVSFSVGCRNRNGRWRTDSG